MSQLRYAPTTLAGRPQNRHDRTPSRIYMIRKTLRQNDCTTPTKRRRCCHTTDFDITLVQINNYEVPTEKPAWSTQSNLCQPCGVLVSLIGHRHRSDRSRRRFRRDRRDRNSPQGTEIVPGSNRAPGWVTSLGVVPPIPLTRSASEGRATLANQKRRRWSRLPR